MTVIEEINDSPSNRLCKACGLCCTGHLFIWTKLRSAELDSIEALGVKVLRSVPSQRGFNQPCPLWQGQCTIYTSTSYPRFCQTYKCNVLKKLLEEDITLADALNDVEQAKGLIREIEALLPDSQTPNFRERFVSQLDPSHNPEEPANADKVEFREKAQALLEFYERIFGVEDLIDKSMEE